MNAIKTILISKPALPYSKIASWSNMYNYLLLEKEHPFDYIICRKGDIEADNVIYNYRREPKLIDKVKMKFVDKQKKYSNYIESLEQIIEPNTKYILHIIDNSGIVEPIDKYLKKSHNRANFYIQYYYQGFGPLFKKEKATPFLYAIDEMFFLTELSYKAYKDFYSDTTYRARVLHNATNSNRFKRISKEQKTEIRMAQGQSKDDFIFMWCSQDRPKKGLHIVLEAFRTVKKQHPKAKLLVIGITKDINQDGVEVIGRVPNNELSKFYQMADVYVFPSLWKEGFGIVLAEALKCGCYCIASAQGGIPEVMGYGKYGVLIDNPNMVHNWVNEMNLSIEKLTNGNPFLTQIPEDIYDVDAWSVKLGEYINEAKIALQNV
ncbi:glycosyltransferase family 4 protein [Patiriisocius marinus]|uniref:glycosyltransferase family 4 protein n=1 Tax=Patiriisocius marinus TaxID=1397112 RepID=UPI00232AFADC|nr:glycosyltransferase family 4 protein [Patiriisocius marinus]